MVPDTGWQHSQNFRHAMEAAVSFEEGWGMEGTPNGAMAGRSGELREGGPR